MCSVSGAMLDQLPAIKLVGSRWFDPTITRYTMHVVSVENNERK